MVSWLSFPRYLKSSKLISIAVEPSPSVISSMDHCAKVADHEDEFKSSTFVSADCQSSFRGLFAGLLLVVTTIVFIILQFVGVGNK